MVTLEIRVVHCITDVSEEEEALVRELTTASEMRMRVTRENNRGQRVAIIDITERDAKHMMDKGKV